MELLMDGFKLLVIGMGWVFLFLTLMIIVIGLLSKIVSPYAYLLEPPPAIKTENKRQVANLDPAMAAAAAAAVRTHIKRGKPHS